MSQTAPNSNKATAPKPTSLLRPFSRLGIMRPCRTMRKRVGVWTHSVPAVCCVYFVCGGLPQREGSMIVRRSGRGCSAVPK